MNHSETLFEQAQKYIPGGVNSPPVRAFRGVGGTPVFFKHAEGAYLYDEDDRRYIDFIGSWGGPMILGHSDPPRIKAALHAQVDLGVGYGGARPPLKPRWRKRCANWCPPSNWCAWSTPAPRPP